MTASIPLREDLNILTHQFRFFNTKIKIPKKTSRSVIERNGTHLISNDYLPLSLFIAPLNLKMVIPKKILARAERRDEIPPNIAKRDISISTI